MTTLQTEKPAPPIKVNTGRIAAILGGVAGIAAALAPVVANLDVTSTVGVVGGIGAVAAVVIKWLDGWQKYEQDLRDPGKLNEPGP